MRLIVIAGPTASGKSAVAVEVCRLIDGEVISADSMQVYRGMDILAALPSKADMRGVAHHMLGILDPREAFSVSEYRERAKAAIEDARARGRTPVLCGGTGLYIDALTRGMRFSEKADEKLRARLKAEAAKEGGPERLHARLCEIDPESARRFPAADTRRVIRSLEIYALTGITRGEQELIDARAQADYEARIFALDWPRQALYERIDARVDDMIRRGLVSEVRALIERGGAHPTAFQAIGIKEIARALEGGQSMADAIARIKTSTRNYAKRQLTWLRRDGRCKYISAQGRSAEDIAKEIISRAGAETKEDIE